MITKEETYQEGDTVKLRVETLTTGELYSSRLINMAGIPLTALYVNGEIVGITPKELRHRTGRDGKRRALIDIHKKHLRLVSRYGHETHKLTEEELPTFSHT